jgi:enamine deaminase RidA (YjgF/YER057c/UK114 family)
MAPSRLSVPLTGLWGMQIDVPYSLMVRDGNLAFSIGQCPLDDAGNVLNPGDLERQTGHVMGYIGEALGRAGLPWSAAAKFIVYHTPRDIAFVARELATRTSGRAVVVPVAIPEFYYPGMLIEIDVYADLGLLPGSRVVETPAFRIEAVAGASFAMSKIAIAEPSLADAAVERLKAELAAMGFDARTPFADQWYADGAGSAGIAASVAPQPSSVVVVSSAEVPLVVDFVHARTGVEELQTASGGSSLLLRKAQDRYWLRAVGEDAAGGHVEQTAALMALIEDALRAEGLTFASVSKSTTCYAGKPTAHELHENMQVRNARYRKPGPASTGIPVARFANPAARVSIALHGATAPGDV